MKRARKLFDPASNPLSWPPASKAWLLFLFCVFLHGSYVAWAWLALGQPQSAAHGNPGSSPGPAFSVLLGTLALSCVLVMLWSYLRRVQPRAAWHEYAALLYYSLSLCVLSYSTGTLSMATGAMLVASPVLGFMLFRPAPVFWSLGLILVIQLMLALGAAGHGWAYATGMPMGADNALSGFALASPYLLVLPFFVALAAMSWYAFHGTSRPGAASERSDTADPLTGLPHRASILTIVDNEWENCRLNERSLSILIMELDHFEQIDDIHGSGARDRALVEATRRMRKVLRRSDYLGRLSEGRFLLVLPSADLRAGRLLAERCHEAFHAQPVDSGNGHRFPITASMGLWCESEPANTSPGVMLQKANAALYRAREHGRDRLAVYGIETGVGEDSGTEPYTHWLAPTNRTSVTSRI